MPQTQPPIDHDRLFKELITTLFIEFLEFFAPQIAAVIDRDSIEFIDKEVFSDLMLGDENIVDILVKIKIAGTEQIILIHIENQSYSEADFAARMFEYFYLLRAKFRLPIYPIAVFSFEEPRRPEPNIYSEVTLGMEVVRYQFQPIQLNQMNWRDYIGSNNPAAVALMAKMNVKPEDRITIRKECLRMFATLKLDQRKTRVINEFMVTYLKLTAQDARQLREEINTTVSQTELPAYEPYLSEFDLLAIEEAELRYAMRTALRLSESKFGTLDDALRQRMNTLTTEQLEDLSVALLNFQTVSDLQTWLNANTSKPA